jgi:ElaA protein
MTVLFRTVSFGALALREMHDLFRLREQIFVIEQKCIYEEIDGLDPDCLHVLGTDEAGQLIACARIIAPGTDGLPHIGRVAVRADQRGAGVARQLMQHALTSAANAYSTTRCALAAQTYLERFYASFGFARVSEDYMLDGIPHVDMTK